MELMLATAKQGIAKAKGTPSEWNSKPAKKIPTKSALFCTSLHLWVAVGDSLAVWWNLLEGSTKKAQVTLLEPEMADTSGRDEFVAWTLPDLVVRGNWHRARQHSLRMVAAEFPDTDQLIADGEQALDIHQQNYTDAGPQHLELLWWEFLPEHWEALWLRSSMNFLVNPTGSLELNSVMDKEQLAVSARFVDKLVFLGVLVEATEDL
jgi:hypothetical protein